MNALAVRLLLLVKKSVLVSRQHLLLSRHFLVPSIDCLCGLAVSAKGCAKGIDYAVNSTQALTLAGFLGLRDAPWDFPIRKEALDSVIIVFKSGEGRVFKWRVSKLGWENLAMRRDAERGHTREDPRTTVTKA